MRAWRVFSCASAIISFMHPDCPRIESTGCKRRIGGGQFVVLLLILLVLYVLSIGPAARIVAKQTFGDLPVVYSPIQAVCRLSPMCGKAVAAYVNLWMPAMTYLDTDGNIWRIVE